MGYLCFDELKRRCQLVLENKAIAWMSRPADFMGIASNINKIGEEKGQGKDDGLGEPPSNGKYAAAYHK